MKKIIILTMVSLLLICGCLMGGCGDKETEDSSSNSSSDFTSTSTTITKEEAITLVKNSKNVVDEIVSILQFKFFYQPDWGTASVEETYGDKWKVAIKGTMSGYTDDYKTKFSKKKFTVTAEVDKVTGYVSYVFVTGW